MGKFMFTAVALVAGTCWTAAAKDAWPQFRGVTGDGQVAAAGFPLEWSAEKNVAWSTAIPGTGWSQPIVWGDQIFVTTAISEKGEKPKKLQEGARDPSSMFMGPKDAPDTVYRWELHCLDLKTGSPTWQRRVAEQKPGIPTHPSNTYATETPATDGERIYLWLASIGKAYAFDLGGQPVWEVDLGVFPMTSNLGTGSSPIVVDGRVIVQSYNEKDSFVVALDPKTGAELWKAPRSKGTSWSTPFVWRTPARTELITCGNGKVYAYAPQDGQVLWEIGGIPSSFSASPAASADTLFLGNNGPFSTAPLFAIKAGAAGDITLPKEKISTKDIASSDAVRWWRLKSGPGMASAVVAGDLLYVPDGSILNCYDAQTGERIYRERLPEGHDVVASPLLFDDKLLLLDEEGNGFVVQTGREFKVLASNKLEDVFWASPAVAGESLLLRGVDRLYCIRASRSTP